MKVLTVTNIVKGIKSEGVWGKLESKRGFQRQSVTKSSFRNGALREKFNFYFPRVFW